MSVGENLPPIINFATRKDIIQARKYLEDVRTGKIVVPKVYIAPKTEQDVAQVGETTLPPEQESNKESPFAGVSEDKIIYFPGLRLLDNPEGPNKPA